MDFVNPLYIGAEEVTYLQHISIFVSHSKPYNLKHVAYCDIVKKNVARSELSFMVWHEVSIIIISLIRDIYSRKSVLPYSPHGIHSAFSLFGLR